jgi:hypothetical protein
VCVSPSSGSHSVWCSRFYLVFTSSLILCVGDVIVAVNDVAVVGKLSEDITAMVKQTPGDITRELLSHTHAAMLSVDPSLTSLTRTKDHGSSPSQAEVDPFVDGDRTTEPASSLQS